jgi:hypothetical protein
MYPEVRTEDFQFPAAESVDPANQVPRVRAIDASMFEWAVTFDLAGVEWEYLNQLHRGYAFHERWPEGMLCHITGATDDGIASLGIWTNERDEQEYFTSVATEVITKAVREQGAPMTAQGEIADFSPTARPIHRLMLNPAAAAFVDIGEDTDVKAIGALGGEPVSVRLEHLGLAAAEFDAAMSGLGYDDELPAGLLVQCVELEDGKLFETQIWTDIDAARRTLDDKYLPAISAAGSERGGTVADPAIGSLKRVSFGGASFSPAWR